MCRLIIQLICYGQPSLPLVHFYHIVSVQSRDRFCVRLVGRLNEVVQFSLLCDKTTLPQIQIYFLKYDDSHVGLPES